MDTSPHRSDFVSVNGVRLHYLDWGGEGPALIFLAGLGCNAHIFDRFAPRFVDRFHVVALTRRGHGESDYPETGYDVDTLTEDIRRFMDVLGIDRAVLAGHSLAGIELTHFAALYPHRVLKLVYLDAAYYRNQDGFKRIQAQNPMKNIEIPGEKDDFYTPETLAAHLQWAYPSFAEIWDALMDEHHLHEVKFDAEGKVVWRMSDEISKAINDTITSYAPEDEKIVAPVLSIYATRESSNALPSNFMTAEQQAQITEFFESVQKPWSRGCIDMFRQNVPHARVVIIPNGHHYIFIKHEEEVFEEMLAFLLDDREGSSPQRGTSRGIVG